MTRADGQSELVQRLSAVSRAMAQLHGAVSELAAELDARLEGQIEAPFNPPSTRDECLAAHRRAHRSGVPGKIASDPELQAFILARIEAMTYAQIVAAVAQNFPPERRISMSGLHRWWANRRTSISRS